MNPNALKDAFERLQSELKWKAPELHGNVIAECFVAVGAEFGALLEERNALAARVVELQRELGERYMADDREKADTTVGRDRNYCARCGAAWHEGATVCWRGCESGEPTVSQIGAMLVAGEARCASCGHFTHEHGPTCCAVLACGCKVGHG